MSFFLKSFFCVFFVIKLQNDKITLKVVYMISALYSVEGKIFNE